MMLNFNVTSVGNISHGRDQATELKKWMDSVQQRCLQNKGHVTITHNSI